MSDPDASPPIPEPVRGTAALRTDELDEAPVPRKQVISWAMWDWATQPFNSVILTFVFASLDGREPLLGGRGGLGARAYVQSLGRQAQDAHVGGREHRDGPREVGPERVALPAAHQPAGGQRGDHRQHEGSGEGAAHLGVRSSRRPKASGPSAAM